MTNEDSRIALLTKYMVEYKSLSIYNIILSVALLFQLFLKQVFNMFSQKKIPIDKWTIIDTLCAVLNVVGIFIVTSSTPE